MKNFRFINRISALKYLGIFSIILISFLPTTSRSQTIAEKTDQLLSAYTAQNKFSGSVLIAKKGEILFEKGYGFADREKKKLNTVDTEYRIGSITKTFTSAIILRLAEERILNINDPVTKYIPDYPYGNKILIRHLLGHTSGIKSYTTLPDYFSGWINESLTPKQTIKHFKHLPLEFEPGSQFGYSNSNYILLSYIAEKASGESLRTLYQTQIISKLNLRHTGKDANNRLSFNKAKGYETDPASGEWIDAKPMDIITPAGAGSMYSSVRDLYTWDRSFYTEKILSYPAKTMATSGYNQEYGYGWIVRKTNGRTEISHSGKSPDGFVSNLIRFPEEEISIIFLSNYGDTNGKRLSNELISIVFDLPFTLPVAKKEIALAGEILNQYVGLYKLNDQFKISVSLENNKLYGLAEGDSQKIELKAESESKFFLKGPEIEIEFIKENGMVKYLLIKQQGGMKLTKVG